MDDVSSQIMGISSSLLFVIRIQLTFLNSDNLLISNILVFSWGGGGGGFFQPPPPPSKKGIIFKESFSLKDNEKWL